jgi:uncharacterized membrane protein
MYVLAGILAIATLIMEVLTYGIPSNSIYQAILLVALSLSVLLLFLNPLMKSLGVK